MLSVYGEARGSELSERRLLFNNRNKGNFSLFKRLKILYSDVGRQYDYMEL